MGNIYLLDCTLRDGGYVNDWRFGSDAIKGFAQKIVQTGVELFEVGFIKGITHNPDRAVFPDTKSIESVIQPKMKNVLYLGMLDMSAPVSRECILPRHENSIDGIRVIFKKEKIQEAYEYCEYIKELGYLVFVNFVGTDLYSDKEFLDGLEKFNTLQPYAVSIVDSFGVIKRKQFLRLVYLADNNLEPNIKLAYHAHNNLQQAFGNAEALVEMNLKRDVIIDACVFGMGRGAGNLNLELFAEYMNENYDTHYKIEPMLEIMDEYLNEIYKTKFWGYSLPLYLSATTGCHPNYAIYLAEKDSLTVKAFHELLRNIPKEDKSKFSKEKAEQYYRAYQENFFDDKLSLAELSKQFSNKEILILAPGKSILTNKEYIKNYAVKNNAVVIAVNFTGDDYQPDYIFSSNMRRYSKIAGKTHAKCIITSNMKEAEQYDYMVNFSSYASKREEIIDNSGLMLLRLLARLGVKKAAIAGMDGYSMQYSSDYFDLQLEYDFSKEAEMRNKLIADEINAVQKQLRLIFLTPTNYITE